MRKNDKPFWRASIKHVGWFIGVAYVDGKFEPVWTLNPVKSPAETLKARNDMRLINVHDVTQYVAKMLLNIR